VYSGLKETNESEMEASYETYNIFVYSEKWDAHMEPSLQLWMEILLYMWIRVTVIYL
jgi:hypothetical protein